MCFLVSVSQCSGAFYNSAVLLLFGIAKAAVLSVFLFFCCSVLLQVLRCFGSCSNLVVVLGVAWHYGKALVSASVHETQRSFEVTFQLCSLYKSYEITSAKVV